MGKICTHHSKREAQGSETPYTTVRTVQGRMIQSPVSEGLETVSLLPGRRHANCVPNKFGRNLTQ